eukprot:3325973-Pleurochrysis_carterae.AAC.1
MVLLGRWYALCSIFNAVVLSEALRILPCELVARLGLRGSKDHAKSTQAIKHSRIMPCEAAILHHACSKKRSSASNSKRGTGQTICKCPESTRPGTSCNQE